MKKITLTTIGYCVFLILLSIANNLILLNMHDFTYYYTIEGIKLAAIICGIEAVLIVPLSKLYFRVCLGDNEFHKRFGEKES